MAKRKIVRIVALLLVAIVLSAGYWLVFYDNYHTVLDGELYRSAQLTPDELREYIDRDDLATVLNLRISTNDMWWTEELAVCKDKGVVHVDIPLQGDIEPTRSTMAALAVAMRNARKPLLIHCRFGADRTSLATALYLFCKEQEDLEPRSAFSPAYGHLPMVIKGVKRFDDAYARYTSLNVAERSLLEGAVKVRPEYSEVIGLIGARRKILAEAYAATQDPQEKQRILAHAEDLFVSSISKTIFPYWYGTSWDYNGTTRDPGKGHIACGYFVTTVLEDAGLPLERVRMAQQASEVMIKGLTTDAHIRRYSKVSIKKFVSEVREWGSGLYVVGLDQHTGFILNENSEVYFVHSTYVGPSAVFKERALDSSVLSASNYRVLGKLSEDDALIKKWLMNR